MDKPSSEGLEPTVHVLKTAGARVVDVFGSSATGVDRAGCSKREDCSVWER